MKILFKPLNRHFVLFSYLFTRFITFIKKIETRYTEADHITLKRIEVLCIKKFY